MTIVEAAKSEGCHEEVVFVCGSREMKWNHLEREWYVYDQSHVPVCIDRNQHTAVDFLLGKR